MMLESAYFRVLLAHGVFAFSALAWGFACGSDGGSSGVNSAGMAGSVQSNGGAPSTGGGGTSSDAGESGTEAGGSVSQAGVGGTPNDACPFEFSCERTQLVSAWPGTPDKERTGVSPDISRDGRYAAFVAFEPVEAEVGEPDIAIFLADRVKQSIERVSVSDNEARANGDSINPSLSADARYVVFSSNASNLVDADTNGKQDVFVRDRVAGTTQRVSLDLANKQAEGGAQGSRGARISSDGRFVSFSSDATNLASSSYSEVFLRDLQEGVTTRITVPIAGRVIEASTFQADLSADGKRVVFASQARFLVEGDTNDRADIFVRDTSAQQTRRVSVSSTGGEANGSSDSAAISSDGRYVVFSSTASNLVAGDTNGRSDIFLHELESGKTVRVSLEIDGSESLIASRYPSISDDGRFITYQRTNDADQDPSFVYVLDRVSGTTRLVSVTAEGTRLLRSMARQPAISGDGQWVTYSARHLDTKRPPFDAELFQIFVSRTSGETTSTEPAAFPKSCLDIRNADATAKSKTYVVDMDGAGPTPEVIVHCDMDTAGGGWTILYSTDGADNRQPFTSDKVVSGTPWGFGEYNQLRKVKVMLSKLAKETLFLRSEFISDRLEELHYLIADRAPFTERLLQANQSENFAVKVKADDGATADAFMGYSNYRISAGGDFSLTLKSANETCDLYNPVLGVDRHHQDAWQRNCDCEYQLLYSYSGTTPASYDGDAGYDVNTPLGSWHATQACDAAEGGDLVFRIAVR